uniref:Chemokine interleukin-8-like domain-containing protein n=1 Tax=Pygocentrus nattereri TaxID=42514 RepID=A0A3B4C3J2_PYGNA
MRTLSALLVLLLICSLQLTSSAPIATEQHSCCPYLTPMKIPLAQVVSYTWTSSDCHLKAIVFLTKKGKQICVDPDTVWVSSHVAAVDKLPTTLSLKKLP